MIESLGDDEVGSGVGVDVGGGVIVFVALGGVEDDPLGVAQAASRKNMMSRMGNIFFNGNIVNSVSILIRRTAFDVASCSWTCFTFVPIIGVSTGFAPYVLWRVQAHGAVPSRR